MEKRKGYKRTEWVARCYEGVAEVGKGHDEKEMIKNKRKN